jgi:hypothetical protein
VVEVSFGAQTVTVMGAEVLLEPKLPFCSAQCASDYELKIYKG